MYTHTIYIYIYIHIHTLYIYIYIYLCIYIYIYRLRRETSISQSRLKTDRITELTFIGNISLATRIGNRARDHPLSASPTPAEAAP